MKGKLNKPREEAEKDLDEIMKTISIGKKYEITGNDFDITITSINFIKIIRCFKLYNKKLSYFLIIH